MRELIFGGHVYRTDIKGSGAILISRNQRDSIGNIIGTMEVEVTRPKTLLEKLLMRDFMAHKGSAIRGYVVFDENMVTPVHASIDGVKIDYKKKELYLNDNLLKEYIKEENIVPQQ